MDALKAKLEQPIGDELHLADVTAGDIDDAAPPFGAGPGLDSLDALAAHVAAQAPARA